MTRSTAALIFMAVVVVACGPAATTATTATKTDTATAAATGGSTTGLRGDACSLARGDVEAVIGPATSQQPTPGGDATACVFTSNEGLLTFAVTRTPFSRTDFDNSAKQMPGAQTESGIGDAAYSSTLGATGASATTLLVLKGSTHLTFQATSRSKDGPALLAALRAVARKVAGSL